MLHIQTGENQFLHLFVKPMRKGAAVILKGGGKETRRELPWAYYNWLEFPVARNTEYRLSSDGEVEISYCYLFGTEHPMEDGITFVNPQTGELTGQAALAEALDAPNREQFHFSPRQGWLNDPNGLCWYKGYYHLYYQFNPHGQEWNNMYWGHAVSRDLVRWIHQPVVLEPQEEVLKNPESLKGGAFSGCAVPLEDSIRFFLTRHLGPMQDCPETIQYQVMTESADSLRFAKEKTILRHEDQPEIGFDFRDPKVERFADGWKMVLGARWNNVPAILLYQSQDLERWELQGPLLTEPEDGSATIECPDFFELDGKLVACGGLMCHVDSFGRKQGTRYYIGRWDGPRLQAESTGCYDFGGDFYAVQSFSHEGRRIAIGCLSDFQNEHQPAPGGAYGSMSIPRELSVREGVLYRKPVREIYTLKGEILAYAERSNLSYSGGNNSWFAAVSLDGDTDFQMLLARNGDASISLIRENGITELRTKGVPSESARFPSSVTEVREIEIFADRRVIEVFLNGGEDAGAKLFYSGEAPGVLEASFGRPEAVKKVELYAMESSWKMGTL